MGLLHDLIKTFVQRAAGYRPKAVPGIPSCELRLDVLQHAMPANHFTVIEEWRTTKAIETRAAVCDHECAAAASVIVSGAQRQSLVRPLVVIGQPHRVDLSSEVLGIRRCGMGINVSVVGPRFDDAEVCRPSGLLEELDRWNPSSLRLASLYCLIAVITAVLDAGTISK
jgi:hypothetical protein